MTPAELLDADAAALGLVVALYEDGDICAFTKLLQQLQEDPSLPDGCERLIVRRMRDYVARRREYGPAGLEHAGWLIAAARCGLL